MQEELRQIIEKGRRIVFFGGAGVSTESGLPDFRSEQGLYQAKQEYGYSPEEMLSHSFFMKDKELFFKYYKENLIWKEALPNDAHLALARLEQEGKLRAVVTQNIDGLHQMAGSRTVLELHGSVQRNYCMECGQFYDLDYILEKDHCEGYIPRCKKCGGVVKPDVVLYEEALSDTVLKESIRMIAEADVLIVGGTSLVVYPAAGLIDYFNGDRLVLINRQPTACDNRADLVLHDSIGKVLAFS
ncbi:NAD-dependent protein deacylase [Clostridiaceae bacterium 68-1-5]|uniref:NAD-dependent protein deacetylase n=1 Tax=Suipraeoptans intestinalis TaxID=2606628 RepID=A0A6N7UTC7_9FIRM|nr:NAD-dependent protein deacylase [Suipraeoptans intestinalis]MSR94733.1 NAD-dependent protein deacylase [Suipraeoptans intestinalis]